MENIVRDEAWCEAFRQTCGSYEYVQIGVYAICADEPTEFIDRWLESMKGANYIWVLVTKKDNPNLAYLHEKQKLPEFQEKLFVSEKEIKPWRFDVARNASLDMVDPCLVDGLVCTDIDEILIPEFWDDYRKMIFDHPNFDRIFYKYAWSHYEDGSNNRVFWYDKTHRPQEMRWHYPVHEALLRESNFEANGKYWLDENKVYLHHYPDNSKSRGSYLPLLELRAQENPEDVNGLFYLAREYDFKDKPEKALEASFSLLIKLFQKEKESNGEAPELEMLPALFVMMGKLCERSGIPEEASYWYSRSISSSYGNLREGYIRLAQRQAWEGKPDEAEKTLELMKNAVMLEDWREETYCWRIWKLNQIKADICMWRQQYGDAAVYMKEALADIRDKWDKAVADNEGFYDDLKFLQDKLKEIKKNA